MTNHDPAGESKGTNDPRQEALAWLEDYGDDLLMYAASRVGDRDAAEELVQETFLAALKSFRAFRQEATTKTWLTAILRRKIVDYFRQRNRSLPRNTLNAPLDDAFFNTKGHLISGGVWSKDPGKSLDSEEFWSIFDDCLSKLSPAAAEAFVLRTMDELDSEEVCSVLGINATNLSVRLYRARLALRQCLEKNWFLEE